MNGDYPGIEIYGGWLMGIGHYLQGWSENKKTPHSMYNMIEFVITEVFPEGTDVQTADKLWMKIQRMQQW